GGDVRRLPAGTRARLGPDVVAVDERLLEPDDHVEQDIAERRDQHWQNRSMDDGDRLGRARSFLIGGVVGASAALAAARRRRAVERRRRERTRHPSGLAAFENAPCYVELIEAEQEED